MSGLNAAALTLGANALKAVLLYAQIHSGPAGTSGTANVGASTRKSITWGSVTGPGNFGISSSLSFTGGTPDGPVYSVTVWSASTSGVFYGEFLVSGSAVFDGSGNYVLSSLDLVGGNASTSSTPLVVTYDATGTTGATGPGTSFTWNHTLASEANAIIVVMSDYSNPVPTTTVKCDGVDMTLIGERSNYFTDGGYYSAVRMFGLLNPPTGTKAITVSSPGGTFGGFNSVSYKNVTSFGNAVTNSGTTEAPSVTVPTKPGQMVVGGFGGNVNTLTGLNGTVRFNVPRVGGVNVTYACQDIAADDRKTEATLKAAAGAEHWGAVGVTLIP